MKILLSVLTIAGGHLLGGRRFRGYLYLVVLAFLPLLSWIAQAAWLVFAPERATQAPVVASFVFWAMLALVWMSSIGLLARDRGVAPTEPERSRRTLVVLEAAAVSVASIVIIGFSVLSIGVVPFLSQERRSEMPVAGKASIRGQELPRGEGSVQFLGTVYVRGAAAGNRGLVFIFDNGFVSRGIDTDPAGKFTYILPPGRWTLLAPYLPGFSGNVSFEIEPPVQRPQLSFDVSEGPVSQTYKFVVRAN
jgi:hypothetical protein